LLVLNDDSHPSGDSVLAYASQRRGEFEAKIHAPTVWVSAMGETAETNSLEVRWFEEGPPPQTLTEWITGFGSVDVSTRTDLYFSPPGPAFNLKLRSEGGEFVEIKRRLGGPTSHTFGPDVEGSIEQWYKWSFSLDHAPDLWTADQTDLWLPVTKTRTLYAFDEADLHSFGVDLSGAGVTVHAEVTEVSALSERAWTCGLEAAGPPDEIEDVFFVVGSELFEDGFPVALSSEQSLGYVNWLRQVASDLRPSEEILVPSNR
jgi:hypothetical protein